MSENKTGVVSAVSKYGSFKLEGYEEWFGTYPRSADHSKVKELAKGTTVNFELSINNKNGKTYYNAKNVNILNGGASAGTTVTEIPKLNTAFPLSPFSEKRSMVRANSMTNAVNIIINYIGSPQDEPIDEIYEKYILPLAKKIEKYESGDHDKELAQKQVEEEKGWVGVAESMDE